MTDKPFKTARTGPVTGPEPDWVHELPPDNIIATITALAGEIFILRERLRAMERELGRRGVLPEGAVESHSPTLAEAEADQKDLQAFVFRIWSEISRGRSPWSSVDPAVTKYFKQPD